MQATLLTARLLLVPLADEHLEDLVAHARRRAAAVDGLGYWVGLADGAFVGLWMLPRPTRPDQGPVEGQAELGYRLLRRWWRQGLASEGARELLRHGFADLGLQRVLAETMAVNTASRATVRAVGLHHVRTFHLPFEEPLPGSEQGEVECALTREQWRAAGRRNPGDTPRKATWPAGAPGPVGPRCQSGRKGGTRAVSGR